MQNISANIGKDDVTKLRNDRIADFAGIVGLGRQVEVGRPESKDI